MSTPDQSQSSQPSLKPVLPHQSLDALSVEKFPARTKREGHLRRLAAGEVEPIVIVEGQSGSGKSTILNHLEAIGVKPAVRLMPRHTRPGDFSVDVPWHKNLVPGDPAPEVRADQEKATTDFYTPSRIFLAQGLYGGIYAFPYRDVIRQLKRGEVPGIILGRGHELPVAIQAIRDFLPLMPVLPINVQVPLTVLQRRLSQRREAFPGELSQRLSALEQHGAEDGRQISALHAVYGVRGVLNMSAQEISASGYHQVQIQDINPQSIQTITREMMEEAKVRSQLIARDILKVRSLGYDHRYIPQALVDVLDSKLLPACKNQGITPCILGGLAVALYLEESRPVSLDIDFTAPESAQIEGRMKAALSSLAEGIEVQDFWGKAVYHVRGMHTELNSDTYDIPCEIDALVLARVQPGNKGFTYEFPFDRSDFYLRRTAVLPSGQEVAIIPPEHIVIQKLTAGRGPELGKFDLFDAAGLLATIPMEPAVIRKLIDCHTYKKSIDSSVLEVLPTQEEPRSAEELCDLLGIESKEYRQILKHRLSVPSDPFERPLGIKEGRYMTIDALKKAVLIDRLTTSLNRIEAEMHTPWDVGGGERKSIAERFDEQKLLQAISLLKTQLLHYVDSELGRQDVYAKRHGVRPDSFFALLPEQQERLSSNGV